MIFRLLLLCSFFPICCCLGQEQRSALFLGNSYTSTNNLPDMVRQIADSKGDTFAYNTHTPGGYTIYNHLTDATSINLIENTAYNYLILQGQSSELFTTLNGEGKHISSTFYQTEHLHQLSQRQDTCQEMLLYMTWGYNNSLPEYLEMQQSVSDNYLDLAHSIDVGVAPVGEAWRYIMENHPEIPLHSPDLSHPNTAGTYLAACVFYTSMFQKSPVGAWIPGNISSQNALTLQQIAYSVVMDDLPRWNMSGSFPACVSKPISQNNTLWKKMIFPEDQVVNRLQFPSVATGYAQCVYPYSLFATHDEGDSWNPVALPDSGFSFTTHFISDSIGFFATGNYAIDSSTLDTNMNNPWGIELVTADHVLFPRIFKTTDAGSSWMELPIDSLLSGIHFNARVTWYTLSNLHLHFDNEQRGTLIFSHILMNEDRAFSIQTSNGGQDWTAANNVLPDMYPTAFFRSADTVYIGGTKENIENLAWWRSVDGGSNWQVADSLDFRCCTVGNFDQYVAVAHPINNGVVVANNFYSPYLFLFNEDQLDWDTISLSPFLGQLKALDEVAPDVYYGLFENNLNHRIGFSKNGGKTWELDSYHNDELSVLTHTEKHIFAAGRNGTILRRRIGSSTSIPESLSTKTLIQVYPNPATDELFFELPANQFQFPLQLTIYDVTGQPIDQLMITSSTTRFSTGHLSSGIYLFKTDGTPTTAGKFIVQ